MHNFNFKILGSTLMLLGTCTGAGMLGLPMVAAQYDFSTTLWLLFSSWLVMTIGAFALLEVNLWMPSGSNLFTMTKNTLGKYGNVLALIIYILLLYSLITLYISNSSDLLQGYLARYNIYISHGSSTLIAFSILLGIEIFGIRIIDLANRWLMFIKLSSLAIILAIMLYHIEPEYITIGEHTYFSSSSFMAMITAFGFAIILPSLRDYLDDNHKSLIISMIIGCIIPLLLYAVWILAVHGMIPKTGANGLLSIAGDNNPSSSLIEAISVTSGYPFLTRLSGLFIAVCTVTSFLGVGLCLVDFIKDILNNFCMNSYREEELERCLNKKIVNLSTLIRSLFVYTLAFAIPLIAVLLNPGLFLAALSYAGTLVLMFLVILPLIMLYRGRYHLSFTGKKFIPGGKITIILLLLINSIVLFSPIINLL